VFLPVLFNMDQINLLAMAILVSMACLCDLVRSGHVSGMKSQFEGKPIMGTQVRLNRPKQQDYSSETGGSSDENRASNKVIFDSPSQAKDTSYSDKHVNGGFSRPKPAGRRPGAYKTSTNEEPPQVVAAPVSSSDSGNIESKQESTSKLTSYWNDQYANVGKSITRGQPQTANKEVSASFWDNRNRETGRENISDLPGKSETAGKMKSYWENKLAAQQVENRAPQKGRSEASSGRVSDMKSRFEKGG
jgi:hypothetical protein